MKCPICKKPLTDQTPDTLRPFCSDRCKLIDLGRWLDGSYQIPVRGDEDEADDNDIVRGPLGR
jgi:uncharacterized protein